MLISEHKCVTHRRVLHFIAVDAGLCANVGVVPVSCVLVFGETVQTLHVLVSQMHQSKTVIRDAAYQTIDMTLRKSCYQQFKIKLWRCYCCINQNVYLVPLCLCFSFSSCSHFYSSVSGFVAFYQITTQVNIKQKKSYNNSLKI